ncbi:MAG: hypothetical protein WCG25_03305 [bacterium]
MSCQVLPFHVGVSHTVHQVNVFVFQLPLTTKLNVVKSIQY